MYCSETRAWDVQEIRSTSFFGVYHCERTSSPHGLRFRATRILNTLEFLNDITGISSFSRTHYEIYTLAVNDIAPTAVDTIARDSILARWCLEAVITFVDNSACVGLILPDRDIVHRHETILDVNGITASNSVRNSLKNN